MPTLDDSDTTVLPSGLLNYVMLVAKAPTGVGLLR